MSAYIVEEKHIQYLVNAAQEWDVYLPPCYFPSLQGVFKMKDIDPEQLGQILWHENFKSVNSRYGIQDRTETYHHVRVNYHFNPIQVLKAISCLDYQSCEHDGWETSEAWHFLQCLKSAAISHLPGYEKAEWGVPENFGHAPVVISLYELAKRRKK